MNYNDNTISMDDRIMHMMLDSIRDKINSLQAELEINYLDEITERNIIKIYNTLCKEKVIMKIVILGTAWPYRGGIADFNNRLAQEFIKEVL